MPAACFHQTGEGRRWLLIFPINDVNRLIPIRSQKVSSVNQKSYLEATLTDFTKLGVLCVYIFQFIIITLFSMFCFFSIRLDYILNKLETKNQYKV